MATSGCAAVAVSASRCVPHIRAQKIGSTAAVGAAPLPVRRYLGVAHRAAAVSARRMVVVASQDGIVPVTFQVVKKVGPGEHLRVVGQPQALGDWDVARAPKLQLASAGDNLWSGEVEGLRVGVPFPFKFIVAPDGAASAANVEWEGIPDRTFQPGGEQTIKAVWDQEGFEAGPVKPGTGGAVPQWISVDADIKSRLDATVRRLSAEARGKQ